MKITFFKNIKTMSGKCTNGNMVFGAYKNANICIARNYVYPVLTAQNELQAEKMQSGSILWKNISLDFIKDLVEYARLYNYQHQDSKKLNVTAYNIFMKVVLGLSTPLSNKEELMSVTGSTLNQWINAGFLPRVGSNREFIANM